MKTTGRIGRPVAVIGLVAVTGALAAGPASAAGPVGAVTRTFSFIARPNSKTATVLNINSLLINARCDARGRPVVFAFSSANTADVFGRVFDGYGRVHIVRNSSFTSKSKGIQLSPASGDFDATGSVLFETSTGKVVTVSLAFDNSTTFSKQNLCTVYGSLIAT